MALIPTARATPTLLQLSPTVYQTEHCLFVIDTSVTWSSPTTAYNDIYTHPFPKLNAAYDSLVAQFPGTYFSVCYIANTGDSRVPNYIDRTAKASGINETWAAGTPNTFATTDLCRYNLPGGAVLKSALAVFDHELGHAWGARAFYATVPYASLSNGHWLPNSTVDCQMSATYSGDGYFSVNKLYGDPVNGFHWQKVDNLRSNDFETFSEQTLYLMGLSKTWPTAYLLNNVAYNSDQSASYSSLDTFDHPTMVAAYGPRSPDYIAEQKRLKVGFVYLARDLAEVNTVYANVEQSVDQFCNAEAWDTVNYRFQTPFLCNTKFRASVDGLLSDLNGNATPTLSVTDTYVASADGTATVNFVAADPDGAAPTVTLAPATNTSSIIGSTVQFSGLPDGVHFFTLKAVDAGGKKTFGHFTIEVQRPSSSTAVSTQPVGQTVTAGATASFSIVATGSPASFTYQWFREAFGASSWNALSNGGAYAGATSATLTVASATSLNGDKFLCVVDNGTGTATSAEALLIVNETAPVLTTQPTDRSTAAGISRSFSVAALGAPSTYGYFNYQWQRLPAGSGTWSDISNGSGYTGSTTTSLSVVCTLPMNGDQLRCLVTNTAGVTTSSSATLTVGSAPAITAQPTSSVTISAGLDATFSVAASGTAPLTYQWYRYGVPVVGATGATIDIVNAQSADAGAYTVTVTNAFGSAGSNVGSLTVTAAVVKSAQAALSVTSSASSPFGAAYFATYTGGTGTGAITWALGSGSTAAGAAINASSGAVTTTGAGTVVITVTKATDANYLAATSSAFTVTFAPAAQATVNITSSASGILGAYTATFAGGSGTGAIVWTLGAGSTAPGAAIDGSSGVVTATGAGTVVINAHRAADSGYLISATTTDFTITLFNPYAFTTLAGLSGITGAIDATGSNARFNSPDSVAVDATGNLYVVDESNNTIRKITPTGDVTTLAGLAGQTGSADGTGSAARFNGPLGIAVDVAGNVYVADQSNHTIRKIAPAGMVSTVAGTAGISGATDATGSAAEFSFPVGVAVDGLGNLYVADSGNYTIRKIAAGGVVTTLAGLAGAQGSVDGTGTAARFNVTNGIAVDASGNVYVADNTSIRKITAGGVVTTLAGSSSLAGTADDVGTAARFDSPVGLAVDSSGNVYVADAANSTLRMITPTGVVTTLAGAPGVFGALDGTGSAVNFNTPFGVAVDNAGYLYVADFGNQTIRKGHLPFAPAFTLQPVTQTGVVGNSVSLTCAATGWPAPTFQWQKGAMNILGATGTAYSIATLAAGDSGLYDVIATNSFGATTSIGATLTVNFAAQAAVTITSTASGTFGTPYTATASGGSGTGVISWALGSGSTAPGAAIDAVTGVVTTTGSGSVVILATKAADNSYLARTSASLAINFGTAAGSVTLGSLAFTYDGTPHTASVITTPASLAVGLTYNGSTTAPTTVGTYAVVGTITDANYTGAASGSLVISPATPTLIWPTPNGIVAGTALSGVQLNATSPVAGSFAYSPASGALLNAGSVPLNVTFTPTDSVNYTSVTAQRTLVVSASAVPPAITTQPLSQPAFTGSTVTFVAAASGAPAPTYQWQKGGIALLGATGSTLTLNNVQLADAGSYALVATSVAGSVTSRFARLVVLVAQQNAITYATTVASTGVTAGGIVNFDYFVTNVGTKSWGANHYLSIRDVNNTFVAFSPLIGILPGETTTANLKFPAPTTPGTYTYYVQALESGVEFFSTQTTVTLTVLAPLANAITYNTTSFPVSAAPGSNVIFTYNVTNTGTATWGANHLLSLRDANGATLSSTPLTVLDPSGSKTVNLTFTVPSAPGSYNYTVQASQTGVGDFGTQANLTLVVLAPQPNAIVYNRVRYPDEVVPGVVLNLKYTLSNAGTQAWGTPHYVSLRDSNETYLAFISLSGAAPGAAKTVEFTFTAPILPGIYTYYVQALEDGIEFFSTQDVVVVTVVGLPLGNAVSYNVSTFPVTVSPGATVNFTANVTNRGTRSWGPTHYLSFRDVDNTFLAFPSLSGIAAGASQTANLSFTAPTTPGIYTYTLQAFEDGISFFEMADTVVLLVQ